MGLFLWYFGTNRRYGDVAHHTILLGPRYRELLRDIFRRKVLAEDFSLYLHRPTATDPSLAPPGCDAFYVLSPVPNLDGATDWRMAAEPYRQAIARSSVGDGAAGSGAACRDVPRHDPARFPGPAWRGSRCRLRTGTGTAAKRVVPSAQRKRGHRRPLSGRAPAPIPGRGCRACCLRRKYSTEWCRMPMRSPDTEVSDIAACRAMLRAGSRSFDAAARLLPRSVRDPAIALYAFCRVADDTIDGVAGDAGGVAWLRERLALVYAGQPARATRRSRLGPDCRPLRDPSGFAGSFVGGLRLGRGRPPLR